jgi:hypothetical protein
MGQEKERLIEQEENARAAARREGRTCAYCTAPLLTSSERRRGSCDRCEHVITKND